MVPSHSSCPLIVIFVTILLSHPNNQKKKKMFRSATNFMPPPRGRPGWTSASKPKKNWIPLFSYKIEYIIHIKECLINTFSNASSLNEKIVACYAIIADSSYFFPFFPAPFSLSQFVCWSSQWTLFFGGLYSKYQCLEITLFSFCFFNYSMEWWLLHVAHQ